MAKLVKQEGILVKIESTPGTDSTPVVADNAVMVEELSWSFAGARVIDRMATKPSFGRLPPLYAGKLMELTCTVELKGGSAAGVAPEYGPLLRACGMGQTIVTDTSVEYAGVSTAHEYATIYYYEDGSLYKMHGVQGTVEIACAAGEIGKLSFTMTGHVVGPTDAALPTFAFSAVVPAPFIGATFVAGSYPSVIDSLSFSLGNVIVMPNDPNDDDGYGLILITDREYTGSFDPQATLIATDDPIGDWVAGTAKAIGTGVVGSTAGNRWEIDFPTAYYTEISPGDRDGIRTFEIGFMAAGDDDAFSLAFT